MMDDSESSYESLSESFDIRNIATPWEKGRKIDNRYLLLQLLGRGGQGEVWEAQDCIVDRIVAIKRRSEDAYQQFLEEARFQAKLRSHRAIIPIYDVCDVEQECYFTMQKIEGIEFSLFLKAWHAKLQGQDKLIDFIAKWRERVKVNMQQERWKEIELYLHSLLSSLDIHKLLRLFIEICDCVEHLHQQGYAHRDLKPGNIFIDVLHRVYIIDFGMVEKLQNCQTSIKICGTRGYIPGWITEDNLMPCKEQLQRHDIYSLGMVLLGILRNCYIANGCKETFHPYDFPVAFPKADKAGEISLHEYLAKVRESKVCIDIDDVLASQLPDQKALLKICQACFYDPQKSFCYQSAKQISQDIENLLAYRRGRAFTLAWSKRFFWNCARYPMRVFSVVIFLVLMGLGYWFLLEQVEYVYDDIYHSKNAVVIRSKIQDLQRLPYNILLSHRQKRELNLIHKELHIVKQSENLLHEKLFEDAQRALSMLSILTSIKETQEKLVLQELQKKQSLRSKYNDLQDLTWLSKPQSPDHWHDLFQFRFVAYEKVFLEYADMLPHSERGVIQAKIELIEHKKYSLKEAQTRFANIYQQHYRNLLYPNEKLAKHFLPFLLMGEDAELCLYYQLLYPQNKMSDKEVLLILDLLHDLKEISTFQPEIGLDYSSTPLVRLGIMNCFQFPKIDDMDRFLESFEKLYMELSKDINTEKKWVVEKWLTAFSKTFALSINSSEDLSKVFQKVKSAQGQYRRALHTASLISLYKFIEEGENIELGYQILDFLEESQAPQIQNYFKNPKFLDYYKGYFLQREKNIREFIKRADYNLHDNLYQQIK